MSRPALQPVALELRSGACPAQAAALLVEEHAALSRRTDGGAVAWIGRVGRQRRADVDVLPACVLTRVRRVGPAKCTRRAYPLL